MTRRSTHLFNFIFVYRSDNFRPRKTDEMFQSMKISLTNLFSLFSWQFWSMVILQQFLSSKMTLWIENSSVFAVTVTLTFSNDRTITVVEFWVWVAEDIGSISIASKSSDVEASARRRRWRGRSAIDSDPTWFVFVILRTISVGYTWDVNNFVWYNILSKCFFLFLYVQLYCYCHYSTLSVSLSLTLLEKVCK
jgi:hypothetical protein